VFGKPNVLDKDTAAHGKPVCQHDSKKMIYNVPSSIIPSTPNSHPTNDPGNTESTHLNDQRPNIESRNHHVHHKRRRYPQKATTITQNRPPTIIGIYGVSGCGKSYLSEQLKAQRSETTFSFYEGSEQLLKIFGNHLENFKRLSKSGKDFIRAKTMEGISREYAEIGKTGIVTGHYSFSNAAPGSGPGDPSTGTNHEVVMVEADKKAYTHILYLKPSPETIVEQVAKDSTRDRPDFDATTVRAWQTFEEKELSSICRENDILFMTIQPTNLAHTIARIQDATIHNESTNAARIDDALDEILELCPKSDAKTMLVLDADNTLAPYDASTLYWQQSDGGVSPLKDLFKSPLGYSYTAFRQMTWLYEQNADSGGPGYFDTVCAETAPKINVHPQMIDLLKRACADKTVGVVIVTCGIKLIWEKVLEKLNLSETVPIIGNGLLSDGYVVTPKAKADIAARLKSHYKLYVCAVGDSEVDLPMLKKSPSGSGRSRTREEPQQVLRCEASARD
jgi:phosphoserine phosphatase